VLRSIRRQFRYSRGSETESRFSEPQKAADAALLLGLPRPQAMKPIAVFSLLANSLWFASNSLWFASVNGGRRCPTCWRATDGGAESRREGCFTAHEAPQAVCRDGGSRARRRILARRCGCSAGPERAQYRGGRAPASKPGSGRSSGNRARNTEPRPRRFPSRIASATASFSVVAAPAAEL
jgi:hypothetical protein